MIYINLYYIINIAYTLIKKTKNNISNNKKNLL
jgi:hypothetical protein